MSIISLIPQMMKKTWEGVPDFLNLTNSLIQFFPDFSLNFLLSLTWLEFLVHLDRFSLLLLQECKWMSILQLLIPLSLPLSHPLSLPLPLLLQDWCICSRLCLIFRFKILLQYEFQPIFPESPLILCFRSKNCGLKFLQKTFDFAHTQKIGKLFRDPFFQVLFLS